MPVFGLLGKSLKHSLSPRLHTLIYKSLGYDGTYNLFEIPPENVQDVPTAMKTLGIKGMSVTIPYKQTIIPFLDSISPEAAKIGAVNTIHITQDDRAVGYNTDYYGFVNSLKHAGVDALGKRVLMCGMSGAGRAVWQALSDCGASEVIVASTDSAKGMPYDKLHTLDNMDIIVNCTPVGMFPDIDKSVVDSDVIGKFTIAVDIVYNPAKTLFLQKAERLGLNSVGGLDMLIYQAIKSFEIWTGITTESNLAVELYKSLSNKFL